MMDHATRISGTITAFNAAMTRFVDRLDGVPPDVAGRAPEGGGWSPAQIAWHVGTINEAFAGVISGATPQAQPAPPAFCETPFGAIVAEVPERLETPTRFQPPAQVDYEQAMALLRRSQPALTGALRDLTPDRACWTVPSIFGGLITVYQVGEWATAHVIRHNQQVKRLIG